MGIPEKGPVFYHFLSASEVCSLGDGPWVSVVHGVLRGTLTANQTRSAVKERPLIYEKDPFRFSRRRNSFSTIEPECASGLGLLSSWLPLRSLAPPLLASGLLVCQVLVSRLLVLVPCSSHGCGGAVLIKLPLKTDKPDKHLQDRRAFLSPRLSWSPWPGIKTVHQAEGTVFDDPVRGKPGKWPCHKSAR